MTTIPTSAAATMSSLEIAELTGKEHRHVMRDIRVMLAALHGEGGVPKFGHTYRNEQNGQDYPCFHLPYDETITLVAGYDAALRFKIVKRWRELEQAKPALRTPVPRMPFAPVGLSASGRWLVLARPYLKT